MNRQTDRYLIMFANTLYGLMAVGLLLFGIVYSVFGFAREGVSYYAYAFISEGVVIALPSLLCIRFLAPVRSCVKLGRLRVSQVILITFAALAGIVFLGMITGLWSMFLSDKGASPSIPSVPRANGVFEFLLSLTAVALMPALCEELIVRGILLPSYERIGRGFAIIASGLLFAVLHGQILALPGHFILGVTIGYLVMETNSIYAGMLYHFIHNGASLAVSFFGASADTRAVDESVAMMLFAENDSAGALVVAIVIPLVIFGLIFYGLIRWTRRIAYKHGQTPPTDKFVFVEPNVSKPRAFFVWAPLIPGVLVSIYLYWLDFVAMFGL